MSLRFFQNFEVTKVAIEEFRQQFYNCMGGHFNQLSTNVPYHIENGQLICIANQLIGFYMVGTIGH